MVFSKIFSSKKKSDNHVVALDIGTEYVKALLFRVENKKAIVVGVGRAKQRLQDMHSGAVTDIAGVADTCNKALENAEVMAGVAASKAILGIAGELVKGNTIIVHYERMHPESKIDVSELKNIIHKVQWKAFEQVREQLSQETGHSEIDVKLVNAAVVDVRIDGYRVTNPVGFQGKDVSISIFNAFAPLVHLGALQTITSELDLDLISIAAEPYAVARCIGQDEGQEFSAIFVDIGGGTTDIAVVSDGGVVGTKMFALGGRAFTKRLASSLGTSYNKAEQVKIDYANGKLTQKSSKDIKKALDGDCKVWASGVELTLSEFTNIDLLPPRILLCGGGSGLPEITELLSDANFMKKLPFSRQPKIKLIKPTEIGNVIDETGLLTSSQDVTPMALANLVVEMDSEEELISGLLKKAIKLLNT